MFCLTKIVKLSMRNWKCLLINHVTFAVLIKSSLFSCHNVGYMWHIILYYQNRLYINFCFCIRRLQKLFFYFDVLLFLIFLLVDLIRSRTWGWTLHQFMFTADIVLGAVGKRVHPDPKIGGYFPFIYPFGFYFELI